MREWSRLGAAVAFVVGALHAGAVVADCKPEQAWRHAHEGAKASVETTNVEGNRKTTLEVCRSANATGAAVIVELKFDGAHDFVPLPENDCTDRFGKWVVIKSRGAGVGDGAPAVVEGTYQVCRE